MTDDSQPNPRPDSSISKENAFVALGLSAKVVRPLAVLGISKPTPIQEQAIPLILAGHDVMGLAQTGTGKTAAFGLPLVHRLLESEERPEPKSVRALILAPTRELVNQIADNLRSYVKRTPVWVSSVVGGQSINNQIRHLSSGTDILVATPGRLLDLVDRKAIFLNTAQYLVLDEADQMLDLGFIHALKKIAKHLGKPRQTLLFSATMAPAVAELSKAYLNDPVRVEVAPAGKAADKVKQSVHFVVTKGKADLLKDMLAEREDDLSLVFARTKHGAEKLMKHLVACGFAAASIHGNKSQGQRDRALRSFKSGDVRILVATDVAARGIDISGVSHVYNYNLPEVPENYVHRIGRTARAGRDGEAIAFCSPEERNLLRQIEKLMKISIPVGGTDGSENDVAPDKPKQRGRGGGGGGGGNRRGDGASKKKFKPRGDGGSAHKKHPRRSGPSEGGGEDAPSSDRPTGKPHHAKGARSGPPRAGKFGGGKSEGGRPRGGKPGGGKPSGERPRGGKPGGGKPSGERSGGGKPGGGKPGGGKPGGRRSGGGGKSRGAPRG
ncbi:MAG: DEAD/DEAH box helicase [Rhizobiaceae bacterium]